MPQVPLVWEEIPEFTQMAASIIEHYPSRFGQIDPRWIVAYGISNKDEPEGKKGKPYEMTGSKEPESFTNTKKYFFKTFMSFWNSCNDELKIWLVIAALDRIDSDHPESGKLKPYDYKDQSVMVRTLGPDWERKFNLPNPLKTDVPLVNDV